MSKPTNPISDQRCELELSPEQMRELLALAADRVLAHLESLDTQPGFDDRDVEAIARSLMEPLPEQGKPTEGILNRLFGEIVPKGLNTASPGFLAYIPGGGLFHAAVADLIANAVNRYVGVWQAAPGLAQLEAAVLRWFCDMVGYPREAGGFLSSGGSIANLSAVVTARSERLGEQFLAGTVYVSDQTHHSIAKAAMLAGLPRRSVRSISVDSYFRIRIEELRRQIQRDRAAGLNPFLLVASAGTTNTGAVDDLTALADLAEQEGLWLHVDAAYGGFFMLTERGRQLMQGMERADSITLDPHKGLFLPYGTGCLIARDRGALERAHRVDADYMPQRRQHHEFVSFCDLSPELSRDFRGLRAWLPLQMHGAAPFRQALEEKLDLALWAEKELRRIRELEIVAPPQLSTLAFRLAGPDLTGESRDQLNRELLREINARQRVHLTGTQLQSGFVLRISILSHRTHKDRLQQGLEDIGAAVQTLRAAA